MESRSIHVFSLSAVMPGSFPPMGRLAEKMLINPASGQDEDATFVDARTGGG